jgi:hypothetical protein
MSRIASVTSFAVSFRRLRRHVLKRNVASERPVRVDRLLFYSDHLFNKKSQLTFFSGCNRKKMFVNIQHLKEALTL